MPISRRELYLDHAGVTIECPRLMSNEQLPDVLADFVVQVKSRPPKPSQPVPPPQRSLPAFRSRKRR
jgi:hypothetical protein